MLLYRVVGVIAGLVAGSLAGAAFKQAWKMVGSHPDAPKATDQDRTWTEVLAAAALQGAIFAIVKAAVDRANASAVKQLTGKWPE